MERFDFFNKLSVLEQNDIKKSLKFMRIPEGSVLYEQGEICSSILFLTEGRVRVVRLHESGQSILLYYFEKGEQCNVNFTSQHTATPAIGTAIAETNIEGYEIPTAIISKLFIENKDFQEYVFSQYAKRLESMASLIEDVRFLSLDTRLLHFLQSQENRVCNFSHEELGDIIGTSREVVSRILKSFEKNNIIKLSRKKIELL